MSLVGTACRTVGSRFGPLTVAARDGAIVELHFGGSASRGPAGGVLDEAARQLDEYFVGTRRVFDLPLAPAGTTFQQQVWQALRGIPYGCTRSYGEIACALGTAPRAVGGACRANPTPIIVPCHRVVATGGGLGGYSGGEGCDTKRRLLEHEAAG